MIFAERKSVFFTERKSVFFTEIITSTVEGKISVYNKGTPTCYDIRKREEIRVFYSTKDVYC